MTSEHRAQQILSDIVERGMKQMVMDHARERGAPEDLLTELEAMNSRTAWAVVSLLYGEPAWKDVMK